MIISNILISSKTKRPKATQRLSLECDSCSSEYSSSLLNQRKNYKKYDADLCRSCKQVEQYKSGLRDKQKEHIGSYASNVQCGKSYEEQYGSKKAEELKQKLSNSISGDNNPRWGKNHRTLEEIAAQKESAKIIGDRLRGKTYEELYGYEHAKKLKHSISERTCGENNPMFGKPSPRGSGGGWSGYFKEHYFRSLLELSYLMYLTNNNIKFETGELKRHAIPYKLDGIERTYFADFYLVESDTTVEVKPYTLLNSKTNSHKFEAALKQCNNFIIVTEKDIDKITYEEIETLIESEHITFDKTTQLKYEQSK